MLTFTPEVFKVWQDEPNSAYRHTRKSKRSCSSHFFFLTEKKKKKTNSSRTLRTTAQDSQNTQSFGCRQFLVLQTLGGEFHIWLKEICRVYSDGFDSAAVQRAAFGKREQIIVF